MNRNLPHVDIPFVDLVNNDMIRVVANFAPISGTQYLLDGRTMDGVGVGYLLVRGAKGAIETGYGGTVMVNGVRSGELGDAGLKTIEIPVSSHKSLSTFGIRYSSGEWDPEYWRGSLLSIECFRNNATIAAYNFGPFDSPTAPRSNAFKDISTNPAYTDQEVATDVHSAAKWIKDESKVWRKTEAGSMGLSLMRPRDPNPRKPYNYRIKAHCVTSAGSALCFYDKENIYREMPFQDNTTYDFYVALKENDIVWIDSALAGCAFRDISVIRVRSAIFGDAIEGYEKFWKSSPIH